MAHGHEWSALVAAELAHEVQNVIMVIQSMGTVLLEELPPAGDGVQLVDELLLASERATRLSRRLMQLAHDNVGDGPADIIAAVTRQIPTLRHIAKGITIELQTPDSPMWTRLSTVDVQQVVFNLAHNAFDAMPAGGTLRIDICVADGMGALLVTDTGNGMDEETVRRCFEPFFTTKGDKGTGLGLHAVRDAVERAGGRVAIESALGRGTAVAIYLPLVETGATS